MVARNRIVVNGSLGTGGVERWSIGINMIGPGGQPLTTPGDLTEWAESAAIAVSGLPSTNGAIAPLSDVGAITDINTYYYPGPGPAAAAGAASFDVPVEGAGPPNMPFQVARVVTLNTGLAGRRYRGRVYMPHLIGTMGPNGTVQQSVVATEGWVAFLAALGTSLSVAGALRPAVYSEVGDILTPVSSISIGNVLDTQRRRTDSLVETRLTAEVP